MTEALRITVRHAEQNFGPYSVDQVNGMLVSGRVLPDDLAWIEGAPEWQKLRTVPGVLQLPPQRAVEAPRDPDESERLVLPAFLLAFFLGVFGLHRFYVGKVGTGVVMALLSLTGVGLIVTGIWYLIDMILIVVGSFRDAEGRRLARWT
jgi:hypothetical protein